MRFKGLMKNFVVFLKQRRQNSRRETKHTRERAKKKNKTKENPFKKTMRHDERAENFK